MSKYEITNIQHSAIPELRRVRALRDIPEHSVKAGDLGGWVESESNLSQSGAAWVRDNAQMSDSSIVTGDALVSGNALVSGAGCVSGNAMVCGNAWVLDGALVYGNALLRDTAQVCDTSVVKERARVLGNALLRNNARVSQSHHVLTARVHASKDFSATLCRDASGHTLTIGCWAGTVDEFRAMIESDEWVEANEKSRTLRRPELLAFAAMCEARIKSWEDDPV